MHPILFSPKPCPNSDKTGSPNGTRSLANASNRRIGSRKNFSPSTDLIAILRQRVGKLARVQARVSKRVGATTPICGNPNSIALGEIRFVGGRQGGGSEKGGEQHQRRWLHQPLVSAIRNGSGSSQCLEVGVLVRSAFLARDRILGMSGLERKAQWQLFGQLAALRQLERPKANSVCHHRLFSAVSAHRSNLPTTDGMDSTDNARGILANQQNESCSSL